MKKGFTLIELLAVILILGIIALIAIPTVNNILKEARMGAFSSTLTNIEKAIENECTVSQIKNKDISYTYTITDGIISPTVEIKGNLPDGTIYVDSECKVGYTLYSNDFTAVKQPDKEIVLEDKKIYTENILNGAVPVLSNNLIPVTIDNDGTVRKADIYSKWYSYEEKKWANAVILTDTGKVEENGIILEDSIESYFVWIPRYKYKLFDMGNYTNVEESDQPEISKVQEIEIIFENKNIDISVGDEVGEYYSHPAFQSFDTNGFWVGKFESTGLIEKISVKPNLASIRNLNVKTIFEASLNYKRNNQSHMMKNTEWGMIVYLSHSKYGINKNININNNIDKLTGYSSTLNVNQNQYPGIHNNTIETTLPYNTETGYLASTTGNISGIYDMSGGVHEYVAAYTNGIIGESGFTNDPAEIYGAKYFDLYNIYYDNSNYYNRILGDATGEMGPFYKDNSNNFYYSTWYHDLAELPNYNKPWFYRGGKTNSGYFAGQFYFFSDYGYGANTLGFRLVLAS